MTSQLSSASVPPSPVSFAGNELRVATGQASVAGRKPSNEDACALRVPKSGSLRTKGIAAVVADGVGTAEAGREAAELAVQGFLADYYSTPESWSVKLSGQRVLDALNRWLYSQGSAAGLSAERGYLSTHSSLVLQSRTGHIFHVGDTRIYRLRGNQLESLTHDQRLPDGTGSLESALGLGPHLRVAYSEFGLEVGDLFLLCSDGVHDYLSYEQLAGLLAEPGSLDECACRLIDAALASGSDDNLSALLVRVEFLPKGGVEDLQRTLAERPIPPLLQPGDQLDGLVVEEILVESPRSQLYRVCDPVTRERWVMKTPAPKFSDHANYLEQFLVEEWIGRRTHHPGLVRVVERRIAPSSLYFLMEPVEGVTLEHYRKLQDGSPDIPEVVDLVAQIVEAARALHRRGTLHLDLKPANIMLAKDGRLKLVDFGCGRVASLHGFSARAGEGNAQVPPGTLQFAAPECRLQRGGISAASDQFSIAVMTYWLLTDGRHPYGSAWARVQAPHDVLALSYQSATKIEPMVPIWMDRALQKAASLNPGERYSSLSEFVDDLRRPNPRFVEHRHLPLSERDPLLFWKAFCGVLAALVLVLLLVVLFR